MVFEAPSSVHDVHVSYDMSMYTEASNPEPGTGPASDVHLVSKLYQTTA